MLLTAQLNSFAFFSETILTLDKSASYQPKHTLLLNNNDLFYYYTESKRAL